MGDRVHELRLGSTGSTVTGSPVRTLRDLIARGVASAPQRSLLLAPDRSRLDYRGLDDQLGRIGLALARLGVGRGDVVAVSLPNGPDLAVAILGAACAATAAPISAEAALPETVRTLDESAARAAIVARGADAALCQAAVERGIPLLQLVSGDRAGEVTAEATSAVEQASQAVDRIPPEPSDAALLLHTSGTTARPKLVPLTQSNLVGAASRVVESLGLTPEDRCLNVMPLVHSHGLLGGLLSSIHATGSVVCTLGFDPREALRVAQTSGATWTTAAPAVYRAMLDADGPTPAFRFLRSASGPMPPDLAAQLEARFGVPLIEVYGLTEAYQVTANPLPPGERRSGTVGRPTGTEVAVVDEAGSFLGSGENGEIVLRGPGVFSGYRAPQEVNDRAFLRGWFRTGDTGFLDAEGYLTITGRLKEVINRGGEKIAPREVEEVLLEHPAIREAVCFPVPDSRLGEEVGALVVGNTGAVLDPPQLRRFVASRLAPTKVPRWFWRRERIPGGESGKPNRLTMAERLGFVAGAERREDGATGSSRVETSRAVDVRTELRSMWMEILSLDEPPQDDQRFFDLGGTSFGLLELLIEVERRFGVRLPRGAILEAPSVGELASRIEEGTSAGAAGPDRFEVDREEFVATVVPIRATGNRTPFFVVSPAGGSVLPFYRLADALGPEQPCFGLEVALRRRNSRLRIEVEEIAAAFLEGMRQVRPRGPWSLGGWSFGGFVAWEIATRLNDRGEDLSHVVLVDTDASGLEQPMTLARVIKQLHLTMQMLRYAKPFLRDSLHVRIAASMRGVRRRGPLRRAMMQLLWKAGIERAEIAEQIERDPRMLELRTSGSGVLRNMRPFLAAARRYRPPRRELELDLIRAGLTDSDDATGEPLADLLGWDRYAAGEIRVHPVTGNHFTILDSAHVEGLATTLHRILA